METQPSPPRDGRLATITIRVRDASGQPVTGAEVIVEAEHQGMTDHGAESASAMMEVAPGVYRGGWVPSSGMGGDYRYTVSVDGPSGKAVRTLTGWVE